MGESSPYRDKRESFFKSWYEAGLPYEEYLTTADETHRERWRNFEKLIELSPAHAEVLDSFHRKMHVLVLSGAWCGDCVRQGPMFRAIETKCPLMSFRYVDNRSNPELQNELRINGAEKVPVVVALSEDFYEVERFGDRHLSAYRKKAMTELGAACDAGIVPPSPESLATELGEWVSFFERLQLMLRLAPQLRKRYDD